MVYMEKSRPRNLQKSPSVHYGVKWVAEHVDKPEELMKWKNHPNDLSAAESIRKQFPSVTKRLLEGKAEDIKIIDNGILILATPPRLYEEWKYDFLKSDICVTGLLENESAIRKKFEEEKATAIKARGKGSLYIERIKRTLDKLVKEGLVEGVLGRGSYFGKNGYPVKDDDIDFILLINKLDKEVEENIVKVLKEIPRFAVALVKGKDTLIKEGEKPELSFIIVSKDTLSHAKGNLYEKYVLDDSVGINLDHLPKRRSEELARHFISLLPKEDNRSNIPRFPSNYKK
jgi:hypothetical protein